MFVGIGLELCLEDVILTNPIICKVGMYSELACNLFSMETEMEECWVKFKQKKLVQIF